jgi:hypothetical protein
VVCCAFAAAVIGDKLGLGKLASCAEPVSRGVSRDEEKDSSSAKGPAGSLSDSAIGGVAATPGPSRTLVGKDRSGDCSCGANEPDAVSEGPADDSWSCHRGGGCDRPCCWEEDLWFVRKEGLSLVLGCLDVPTALRSVSGVAGMGSSKSSGVKCEPPLIVSSPLSSCIVIRGFLLRRCKLASSAASLIEGMGGESSLGSRLRRPETARMAGFWTELGRTTRFGVANTGGPLNDSTFLRVPFDDRRESCRTLCCK